MLLFFLLSRHSCAIQNLFFNQHFSVERSVRFFTSCILINFNEIKARKKKVRQTNGKFNNKENSFLYLLVNNNTEFWMNLQKAVISSKRARLPHEAGLQNTLNTVVSQTLKFTLMYFLFLSEPEDAENLFLQDIHLALYHSCGVTGLWSGDGFC